MPLWTDLISPDTQTGYARESQQAYEQRKGSLSRWLPNKQVQDIAVRMVVGASGLVDEARFRDYDAEPEFVKGANGKRVTVDLPALSLKAAVSEYLQLKARNAPDDAILNQILITTDRLIWGLADRVERLRGTVLVTGKATIDQSNFAVDNDFGRDAALTFTAPALWSVAGTDRLTQLQTWYDLYVAKNNEAPGAMLMSTRGFRALQSGTQFQTQLLNGGARNATADQVRADISAAGLPDIYLYDRSTNAGGVPTRVIPDDRVLFLPSPDSDTDLGATFWGTTLTAMDPDYRLASADMPGAVVGTYRNEKVPKIAEVEADSIVLPILANANLSMCVKVL